MVPFRPLVYHPVSMATPSMARPSLASPKMGALTDMNALDWLLLGGGVIVGGAGINGLVTQFSNSRPNAIGIMLNLVLSAVGLTLFIQKGSKAIY